MHFRMCKKNSKNCKKYILKIGGAGVSLLAPKLQPHGIIALLFLCSMKKNTHYGQYNLKNWFGFIAWLNTHDFPWHILPQYCAK